MNVHRVCAWYLRKAEGDCEAVWMDGSNLALDPLEQQPVFLTTELSLQP